MAVKPFKTKEELEALKQQFIQGADQTPEQPVQVVSEWSYTELKKLDEHQLAERLERITNQSTIMTWLICMHIRDRFRFDRDMGQFINDLRKQDEDHPLCVSQQTINRYIHAGRFVSRHKIYNLNKAGISATAIYALSSPTNSDVADYVYHEVKRKGYPVAEIQRRIEQAKSVPSVAVDLEGSGLQRISYDRHAEPSGLPSRTVPVEKGVALDFVAAEAMFKPPVDVVLPEPDQEPESFPSRVTEGMDRVPLEEANPIYIDKPAFCLADVDDADLLLELASRDASALSDDQAVTDLLIFAERFKRSHMKLIPLFMTAAQQLKTQMLTRH